MRFFITFFAFFLPKKSVPSVYVKTVTREKKTVFCNNSCRKFNFFRGTGKNAKKWGFNPIKNIFTHQYFSVLSASLIKYDQ